MVINYELAWRRPELADLKNFTLMLDESSLIQNPRAKQTKFILGLDPDNVILLSGTPTSGKYENLWSQAHLLGWPIKEKTFLKQYVNWEWIDIGGGVQKPRPHRKHPYKNTDRLKRKLKDYGAVFMKTEEVFDLPNQNYIDVWVDTTDDYDEFLKTSYITVSDEELVGDTSLTRRLGLRKLCGGYNPHKLTRLRDLVESTKDKVIVFYNYNIELDAIKTVIPKDKDVGYINGKVKTDGEDILLVQYQAGAMGLNLQESNKIIYYSPTDRVDLYMQSQKRIHRIGQDRPCFYYRLTCKDSIEVDIYRALERGENYTDELFRQDGY